MTEQEKRLHRCCFAGHRPEGILLSETTAKEWLRFQIQQAITDGYTTFITGMGMGVDIWAAEIVIELRSSNPSLHLIAVEPPRLLREVDGGMAQRLSGGYRRS